MVHRYTVCWRVWTIERLWHYGQFWVDATSKLHAQRKVERMFAVEVVCIY